MASSGSLLYYILFANYTHGLALQELFRSEHIPSRIAPTPRSIQGELSCGMSLLIRPEDIDAARDCIQRHQAEYYDIVPLSGQLQPRRDKFC